MVISLKEKNRVVGECRQRDLIYTGCSEATSMRLGLKEWIGIGQEDWEWGRGAGHDWERRRLSDKEKVCVEALG